MSRLLEKVWLYWFVTDILLLIEVTLGHNALQWAIVLTLVQVAHFYWLEQSLSGFATQVRMAYLILLLSALWSPLYWVLYFVILGTSAMVIMDYCFLARFMSLMPWNHSQKISINMIFHTFFSKPVSGSVKKQ